MKGYLVVNSFYGGKKMDEISGYIIQSGWRNNVDISVVKTGELLHSYECLKGLMCDFVLFWDKDVILARMLEDVGYRVFNSSQAISTCDNKALTYMRLYGHGVAMPKTVVAPLTFEGINYCDWDFAEKAADFLGFPMVVKELYGSFGQQVYLARDMDELKNTVSGLKHKGFLMQEMIDTSFGKDIRINIVGGEVVSAMLRYNENGDFRSNISNGGSMRAYEPSEAQKQIAIEACKALGLDFAGVDVLFGAGDEPLICEVNSNPHFKSSIDCTGIDVSDHIIKHIKEALR